MIIVHIINSLNKGGAEQVLKNLILNDKINEHYIYTFIDNGELKKELENNVKFIKNLNLISFFFNPLYFFKIIKEIKLIKPNIIQSWMYHSNFITIFLKLFIKTNIFWNIRHGNIFKSQSKILTKCIVIICAVLSYHIPLKIIYCSVYSEKNHIKILYDKRKSVIIYNGINSKIFFANNDIRNIYRKRFKINNESFVIGMIANWRKQKNHELLFSSLMNFNHDYKLILVGKNINSNNKSLINKLLKYKIYDKTIILENLKDINDVYNFIDLCVLTSFDESFPNVLAESMMASTLTLSTNVGEVDKIIYKYGWIINSFNLKQLNNFLENIFLEYKNKSKWDIRREEAKNHINLNFNIDLMIKNYIKLWKLYS